MNTRTFIKATAIVLTMFFFFSSCSKDEANETPQDVSQQEVSEDDIEKTEIAIENVISSSTDSSVDKFVSQIQKLENVKNVEVEDDLVYITTSAGELISVDLNGTTSQSPILAEDKVDTCGTYIQSIINNLENQIADSTTVGIENEPVAEDSVDVIGDYEDEPIETRAISLHNRTILSKKKMAVWSPWDEFKSYDESYFCSAVKNAKLEYTIIKNYGPSSFASFGNYDLVFVSSHGSSDGAICIPQKYWNLYVDQFAKKKQDGKKYVDVDAARKAGIRIHFEKKENGEILKSVALERVFFEKHLSKLYNTIIWTSACNLGKNNSAFLLGALTKGCPEFYGADNVCNGAGPMSAFRQFIPLFANGASTKVAFDNVDKSFRIYNNGKVTYKYIRHGNRNITYVNPYITGIRESNIKTVTLGVRYQYSLNIAGSTNSETQNHFGIRLENLKNNQVQNIPLTSSNVLNASCQTLKNAICVYLANIKLNGLMPNTDYRYRTYIMIGNKCYYSNQYQTFNTRGLAGRWKCHEDARPDGSQPEYNYTSYLNFTEKNFDESNPDSGWLYYSTKVAGNTITFETWTPPYHGGCGADWCCYYVGSINDEWTHIKCTTWGWMSWGSPQPGCEGRHHHDMEFQDVFEFWRLPDTYSYVK